MITNQSNYSTMSNYWNGFIINQIFTLSDFGCNILDDFYKRTYMLLV